VLLLDEPLSALDANLREEMRVELKNIQRRIGVATVFVTHDQGEALAMSDLVVVMNKGRIEQMGAPTEVYEQPRSEFVASFLGNANFLPATVQQVTANGVAVTLEGGDGLLVGDTTRPVSPGEAVRVVVRAEKIEIASPDAQGLQAKVADVDYLGSMARYQMELRGGQRVLSLVSLKDRALRLGETVALRIDPQHCRIL